MLKEAAPLVIHTSCSAMIADKKPDRDSECGVASSHDVLLQAIREQSTC